MVSPQGGARGGQESTSSTRRIFGVSASGLLLSPLVRTERGFVAKRSETDLPDRSQVLSHAHVALLRSRYFSASSGAWCSSRSFDRSAAVPIPGPGGPLCVPESSFVLRSLPAGMVLRPSTPQAPAVGDLDVAADRPLGPRRVDLRLQPVIRLGGERAVLRRRH